MFGGSREPHDVLGPRTAAGLIDFVLVLAIGVGLAALAGDLDTEDGLTAGVPGGRLWVWAAVFILYPAVTEALTGQTFGKALFGLHVVDDLGQRPSWWRSLHRNIFRVIDVLPAAYLLGFIVAATTKRHQRIGDYFADTLVVRLVK